MTKNTVVRGDKTFVEVRYFISSLGLDVGLVARAVRKHWMVESLHWRFDVTFGEDADRTIDGVVAQNLSVLRKLALNVVKLLDFGKMHGGVAKRRNVVGWALPQFIDQIWNI